MQSQVISFRASGHFLNWIEAQRLEGESANQAAQRLLKELSGTSTGVSTKTSTASIPSFVSTEVSTVSEEALDKLVGDRLDPVLDRIAGLESRLGKLRA